MSVCLSHRHREENAGLGLVWSEVVPSINSSALKNLSFSDTARLDEFFDHITITNPSHLDQGSKNQGG
jgi:hypothetical protein